MLKIALLATGAAIIDAFASTPDPNTVTLDLVGRKDVGGCAGQGGKNLRFSTSTAENVRPKRARSECSEYRSHRRGRRSAGGITIRFRNRRAQAHGTIS